MTKMTNREKKRFKKKLKEKKKKLSFYEELCAIDIIDPVMELYADGIIEAHLDGKIRIKPRIPMGRTWTFASVCPDRKCGKWLSIYALHYKILPPPCKQCWKVVYAPDNVMELIRIREIQAKLGLPAKCGIEKRDYTSGLGGYRAFWYCPFFGGLKGGRDHFALIKEKLIEELGAEYINTKQKADRFFLKRGCTELERDYGPSDQWDKYDFSAKFKLLETVWEDPIEPGKEWTPLIYTNTKRWIEFAVAHGDTSVLAYINKPNIGIKAVKYEDSDHKAEKYNKIYYTVSLNESIENEGGKAEDESGDEKQEDLFRFES